MGEDCKLSYTAEVNAYGKDSWKLICHGEDRRYHMESSQFPEAIRVTHRLYQVPYMVIDKSTIVSYNTLS